jgi:hypothetical protein
LFSSFCFLLRTRFARRDRHVRVFEPPKRWDALLVGSRHKNLQCYEDIIQPTVPLCLTLVERDGPLGAPWLWIGGSTGDITVRDSNDLTSVVAKYEDAHADGVTCIRRVNSHNLNTVITAGMGGKINLIDPTRMENIHAFHADVQTIFRMKNGEFYCRLFFFIHVFCILI